MLTGLLGESPGLRSDLREDFTMNFRETRTVRPSRYTTGGTTDQGGTTSEQGPRGKRPSARPHARRHRDKHRTDGRPIIGAVHDSKRRSCRVHLRHPDRTTRADGRLASAAESSPTRTTPMMPSSPHSWSCPTRRLDPPARLAGQLAPRGRLSHGILVPVGRGPAEAARTEGGRVVGAHRER